jgi:hypothetical protein
MNSTRMLHAHLHANLKSQTIPRQRGFRVGYPEADAPRTTPWNDLCDEVLLPVGSLFVVFLLCSVVIWLS